MEGNSSLAGIQTIQQQQQPQWDWPSLANTMPLDGSGPLTARAMPEFMPASQGAEEKGGAPSRLGSSLEYVTASQQQYVTDSQQHYVTAGQQQYVTAGQQQYEQQQLPQSLLSDALPSGYPNIAGVQIFLCGVAWPFSS